MDPYYIEMKKILKRLEEINKMHLPQYRSYRKPDGTLVERETVPEHIEQEELIKRWYELQAYDRAIEGCICKNDLLVALRLDLIAKGLFGETYDPYVSHCTAVSVYENRVINF